MKYFLPLILLLANSLSYGQTEREKRMMDEINLARTQPQAYIEYIEAYLEFWNSNDEERIVAEELKKELRTMEPLEPLKFSKVLYKGAIKHGTWMKSTGKFEHSDLPYGENLVSGDEKVRFAVLNLLIDYGIPDRGHRKNILSSSYTLFAAHEIVGTVGEDKYVFVQEFQ